MAFVKVFFLRGAFDRIPYFINNYFARVKSGFEERNYTGKTVKLRESLNTGQLNKHMHLKSCIAYLIFTFSFQEVRVAAMFRSSFNFKLMFPNPLIRYQLQLYFTITKIRFGCSKVVEKWPWVGFIFLNVVIVSTILVFTFKNVPRFMKVIQKFN